MWSWEAGKGSGEGVYIDFFFLSRYGVWRVDTFLLNLLGKDWY